MHIPFRRSFNRKNNEMRPVEIIPNYYPYGDGSCLVKYGNTHVVCAATIDERVPLFLKHTHTGWITAEYGMLPCASPERIEREAAKGKQSGRTLEIQRLIGRSLRSIVDLKTLGERQIKIDCDVLQADGGTRTASITGSYVALYIACTRLLKKSLIPSNPIQNHAVAVSCGIVNGEAMCDLDYMEDSNAEVDANFIMANNKIIEIQACGEKHPFDETSFKILFDYAKNARNLLIAKQDEALATL
jgi:ribonuclease PH